MGNIVLNKPATASSFVAPYAPARAVNGSVAPVQRWLSNTVPSWLCVNLQKSIYVNRWVVRHMGASGWGTPDYVLSNFKLQGSLDNANWFDIDTVSNNAVNVTDRTFSAVEVAFVRVYITTGLRINPKLASIVELEVYEAPPTSPYLSNITLEHGTLTPAFSSQQFNYTANVGYDVATITITPTAEDPNATIKVAGTVVPSGQPSQAIELNVGSNSIVVETTSKIGGLKATYTINVTRASNPYLTGLVLKNTSGKALPITPTFVKTTLNYTAVVSYTISQVTITPTAEDPASATIKVEGTEVISGGTSSPINLVVGDNTINVDVTSRTGVDSKPYVLIVTRRNA